LMLFTKKILKIIIIFSKVASCIMVRARNDGPPIVA
jgi:hypothetical protein